MTCCYLLQLCFILLSLWSVVNGAKNMLVFNHLPKAGGTEIKASLKLAFGHHPLYIWSDYVRFTQLWNSSIPLSDKELSEIRIHGNRNSEWLVLTEYQGIEVVHQRHEVFMIGSIREPCSYYLSDWAYKSGLVQKHHVQFHHDWQKYLGKSEDLSSAEDVRNFRNFVNLVDAEGKDEEILQQLRRENVNPGGYLTQRFLLSYSLENHGFSWADVDCWVREEYLHEDLKLCLDKFQSQGGSVPKYEAFISYVNEKDRHSNPSHHKPCAYYYDAATTRNVMKSDSFIYRTFNMTAGCCNPVYSYPTSAA